MAKFKLMAHQVEGVKFLDSVDGIGALLWEPGVGKTGATLAWIDRMAQRYARKGTGEFRVLVIAPLTASDTWVLQAPGFMDSAVKARMLQGTTTSILTKIRRSKDWRRVADTKIAVNHKPTAKGLRLGGKVTILSMSAGAVSSYCLDNQRRVAMLQAVRAYKPHLIVVDESQIIKAATSNISKAMYAMGQLSPHRIILTGTVSPHSPLDVYGQWRFLAPWTFSSQYHKAYTKTPLLMTRDQMIEIEPWHWDRFEKRYGKAGGYKGKSVVGVDEDNIIELHDRVAERSMVVLKKDALDLPPTRDVDMHITLSAKERKAYDEMRRDLVTLLDSGEEVHSPNVLAKIMKLRQIHAGFVRDTTLDQTFQIGDSLRKAITDHINVTLDGENRIVVFAYFKSEVAALADSLKKKGRTVETVTGATKPSERLAIRQRFADVSGNPEQVVLVAQARTMSLSVNELVTASHAIYASMSERRDDWVQSRGRLDRNGQTRPVTFWNFFALDTVGEVMIQTHKFKGQLEKNLLDHIRSVNK
jgi:hypothetical protein